VQSRINSPDFIQAEGLKRVAVNKIGQIISYFGGPKDCQLDALAFQLGFGLICIPKCHCFPTIDNQLFL